jgi:hypothetical protein
LIQAIGQVLVEETKPLRAQLEALQARLDDMEIMMKEFGYRGQWDESICYHSGNFVSHMGSMWFCLVNRTTARPQTGSSDWALAVSRGRAGKNGVSIPEPRQPTQVTRHNNV